MKDQLLLLQQLQDIDIRTQEVTQSIEALPAALLPAKEDLLKLEALLSVERKKIEETEAWRQDQENLVAREEAALKDAKSKLQEAKNARDFSAATREIDNKKRSIREREQEILKVYEALDSSKKQLEQREEDVKQLREHVEAEEAKFGEELQALRKEAEEIMSGRDAIAQKIDPQLLQRYDNVIKRRGLAVVPVKNGVCQGCHMALPPQLNNVLARCETIESCRQCNRLLYREELLEEAQAEHSE